MSIYLPSPNDLFLVDLKEWCKNNPLTEKDLEQQTSFKSYQIEEARQSALKRNYTIIKCPHCNKEANVGNYKRWHGDNCGKTTFHSEETKKKISTTLSGREFSNEHKRNLSEANRRRKGIKFKKKVPSHSSSSTSSDSTIYSAQKGQCKGSDSVCESSYLIVNSEPQLSHT